MASGTVGLKHALLFFTFCVLVTLIVVPATQTAYADSNQTYASVSLQYFTIQVEYPTVVFPGSIIQVQVQAVAKSSANLNSLTASVYYTDGLNLHQMASAIIVGNQNIVASNAFTNDMQVAIPQGIPRTSLFATFTESVEESYMSSYGYSQDYYGYDNSCGYYYNMSGCSYYQPYYNSYPQYSYVTTSDTGISPLSYVNATTPEYAALLSQYQNQQQQLNQSRSQNQNLQLQVAQQNQELSQLQSQNLQLKQNLQNQQNTISQKDSDNSNLNSQLTAANILNRGTVYLAVGFGIIAIIVILLAQRGGRPRKTQSVNPYAANYAPPEREHPQTE